MLGGRDDWLIGIIVGEIHVGLLLNGGIVPAVVDAQGYEIDIVTLHASRFYGRILRFEVTSKLRAIMSSIAFREDSELSTLVLGELCVEGL